MVGITLDLVFQCLCITTHLTVCLASHSFSDLGIVFTMLFQSSDKLVLFVGGPKDIRLIICDVGKDLCFVFHVLKSSLNSFERPCAYSFSNLLPLSPVLPYSVNKSRLLFISPIYIERLQNIITTVLRWLSLSFCFLYGVVSNLPASFSFNNFLNLADLPSMNFQSFKE